MSDKSFGDYNNKNIMKNPLLSTAVTGLSIEDLTQNAVLLPVAQQQVLHADQDAQIDTLTDQGFRTQNAPSGDGNSNIGFSNVPLNKNNSFSNNQQGQNYEKTVESLQSTVSEASVKTEDDFDVNEYFARLQGTRYVSAPLNSLIKDDQNGNLNTVEDNLEEISLDEPDKSHIELQQSLTADIAQNFSQLPTVLPQVASAVLNSFSNMLNYKSREQTPDGPKQNYNTPPQMQETSIQAMSLGAPEEIKELAPPPKQPTAGGLMNYRITTKKKTYAQVPGLSSGDPAQNVFKNDMPSLTKIPPYYLPKANVSENLIPKDQTSVTSNDQATISFELQSDLQNNQQLINKFPLYTSYLPNISEDKTEQKIFTPMDNSSDLMVPPKETSKQDLNILQFEQHTGLTQNSNPICDYISQVPGTTLIPPPPMFSNLTKKDNQTVVEKSILPPSLARRISTNQPVMKTYPHPTVFIPTQNIFNPASISDNDQNSFNVTSNFQSLQDSTHSISKPVSVPYTEVMSFIPANTVSPSRLFIEQSDLKNESQTTRFISTNSGSLSSETSDLTSESRIFTCLKETDTDSASLAPAQLENSTHQLLQNENNHDPSHLPYGIVTTNTTRQSLPEPPKLGSQKLNYRMSNKKPQYYSGPIGGYGDISNNLKPIMPVPETDTFPKKLLIPEQTVSSSQNKVELDEDQITAFDITRLTETFSLQKNSDTHSTPGQIHAAPEYNTPFDLSRSTSENYEKFSQEDESKGYGIIGSLKSRLNSLNINKIQNSVTTFFDPSYNNTKKSDVSNEQKFTGDFYQSYNTPSWEKSVHDMQNNFEIFVPHTEKTTIYDNNQSYDPNLVIYPHINELEHHNRSQPNHQDHISASNYYDAMNNDNHPNVFNMTSTINTFQETNLGSLNNQQIIQNESRDDGFAIGVYTTGNPINLENKKSHDAKNNNLPDLNSETHLPPFTESNLVGNVFTSIPLSAQMPLSTHTDFNISFYSQEANYDSQNNPKIAKPDSFKDEFIGFGTYTNQNQNLISERPHDEKKNTSETFFHSEQFNLPTSAEPKFIVGMPITHNSVMPLPPLSDFNVSSNSNTKLISKPLENKTENRCFFLFDEKSPNDQDNDMVFNSLAFQNNSLKTRIDDKILTNYGTDNITRANVPNPSSDIQFRDIDLKNLMEKALNNVAESFDKNVFMQHQPDCPSDIKFSETKLETEDVTDLDICETCREVNRLIEKEPDGLTAQLIENITSPIQLSNPVEVPLAESSNNFEERADFDPDQCAEISQITEETFETIYVQSATELLEDVDKLNPKIDEYGWCMDKINSFSPPNLLLEHDYTYHQDSQSTEFLRSNQIFYDKIPNNASDEIKAEIKNSNEDVPFVLPRQTSIPSAPAEEDFDESRSDEAGILDVQSIEQDAKKDFPIFDDYIIEPSETDDDKIECKHREKTVHDTTIEKDTFANRIEKFKKMEENFDHQNIRGETKRKGSQIFDSPAISIASYFDTGNYAVETHYRNSKSSPSGVTSVYVDSLNAEIRIPPGFEEVFKRKLSITSKLNETAPKNLESMESIPNPVTKSNPSSTIEYETTEFFINADTISDPNRESDIAPITKPEKNPMIETSKFFEENTINLNISEVQITKQPIINDEIKQTDSLPDPFNFFTTEKNINQEVGTSDANRLASYFAFPSKPDHSKTFFELSQGQDHYKQEKDPEKNRLLAEDYENLTKNKDQDTNKSFFEIRESQDNYKQDVKNSNLGPNDNYIENIKLMTELASCANADFRPTEHIVRTVNYFTVEYDNYTLKKETNTGKLQYQVKESLKNNIKSNSHCQVFFEKSKEVLDLDSNRMLDILNLKNCKYCCNNDSDRNVVVASDNLGSQDIKFRKSMDNQSSEVKTGDTMTSNCDRCDKKANVSFDSFTFDKESNENVVTAVENNSPGYTPVKHHWFYKVDSDGKSIWRGFSLVDSSALEEAFLSPHLNENTSVPTDGGRYDVCVVKRLRFSVYWSDKPTDVRRCSWFYKGNTDARYIPYVEAVAEKLEEEYHRGVVTGEWHRRLLLPDGEMVVMHGPTVMVHFLQATATDPFATPNQSAMRSPVLRRGCDESEIEDTEPSTMDHLLLLCHGVGSACDMRFRAVEEVVDDFRTTSLQLIQSHYKSSYDKGAVSRIEVLPISWHSTLHSGEAGVDRRLAQITLESIPKLRNFTNDTILDVLFYTSPVFCQTIVETVCRELNRIYKLFKSRNPKFNGGVSLGGHSLGSVILYDLLCHQQNNTSNQDSNMKQYVNGSASMCRPVFTYPELKFTPDALYALGSPIAIFECIRGVESFGLDFSLPTCKNFFNIFHPYDPIAYRIEPLINPDLKNVKPFLIPHHKGRKRMHLELKDTMFRVGADLKQRVVESIWNTWASMWRSQPPPNGQLEKVVEEELEKQELNEESKDDASQNKDDTSQNKDDTIQSNDIPPEMLGKLNDGRRVDYVLQEAPFELINEYLFAMSSHVCYWESEDTMLLILHQIYDALGVQPDSSIPQQTLTVERTRTVKNDEMVAEVEATTSHTPL